MLKMTKISQNLINYIKKYNEEARKYNEENKAKGNWTSLMIEDEKHWIDYGIFTLRDLVRQNLIDYIWDEFKSVNGIRPRFMNFSKMGIRELRQEVNYLMKQEVNEYEIQ
jgi:hypothetical protein